MIGWRVIVDYGYDGGKESLDNENIIYLDKEIAESVLEEASKRQYVSYELKLEEYEIRSKEQ